MPAVDRAVLWQPTFDGARHLTQFLRLRVAALLASGASRATVAMLREESSRGETLEVAGYRLSTGLAAGLDAVTPPAWLPPTLGRVRWFEIVRNEAIAMPEIARRLIDSTRGQGGIVELTAITGEPFWSSTEITVNRNLVDLSADFLAPGGELSANRGGP